MSMKRYAVARYETIAPVDCPCGESRRAFVGTDSPASMHRVTIKRDSRAHYHRKLTEIYYVLKGRGRLEADGERVALAPGTAVLIRPGCRHRAVGRLEVLVVAMPPFDPADEFGD